MLLAITRGVSARLAEGELSFVAREPIDLALARTQHRRYVEALRALGCTVRELPADDDLADSVFVEDTAVVVDELAVVTRPGAPSRRGETASIAAALAAYRPLREILEPGTLDGGDVLVIGRRVFVGASARSNADGIAQLREALAPHGYRVQGVALRDCLHLKSAVTAVAADTVLVNPDWVDTRPFDAFRQIRIDPSEPHAANTLRLPQGLIQPACFPRTRQRLEAAGIVVTGVDLSELQKAEGAVTCCSLVFRTNHAA